MKHHSGQPRRARNAVATRAAILQAARACFTRDGYEQVGVRDIAAVAGVNAALVIRYFGSKEQLFAEALREGFSISVLLDGPRADLGERIARYVAQKDAAHGSFDPLIALLRSSTNEQAAGLLRTALDEQFIYPLAAWLGGEQALLRAGLIAAYLTGLAATRYIIRSEPLASADVEALVALVGPVLQGYIDGPLG